MPTLARSTVMCCLSKTHVYTASEIDFCVGWPSIVTKANRQYHDLLQMDTTFGESSGRVRRSLAGNGMCLPQVYAWLLYSFGNLVRKPCLQQLLLPLRAAKVPTDNAETEDCELEDLDS